MKKISTHTKNINKITDRILLIAKKHIEKSNYKTEDWFKIVRLSSEIQDSCYEINQYENNP